jgi:hypothetical protein
VQHGVVWLVVWLVWLVGSVRPGAGCQWAP